ncbi:hypothetical protein [Niabella drilacis]|uniref:Fasciclin domain-containing protein n=1 Tax=Niabella drilacis (strain DSM 25811 / CCM 8410 / CCUG 62505 / LMG 26954 / E90) TaxID=1285928 RepID=A0A1G7B465_NIADE|nr:hypothetical protein [Niabella drilacis]SDE21700.1 hypothetical protein SAMN04487894_1277 [Niabella drilacis]
MIEMRNILTRYYLVLAALLVLGGSCKKDYYRDTGTLSPEFNGTVLEYLRSRPHYFDSTIKIIKMAGMENVFNTETITFYAPMDSTVRATLETVNGILGFQGKPPVTRMEQIKPAVWKKYLCRYLFKGAKSMNDYPQLDPQNLSAFSGQVYSSYDGQLMNAGVIQMSAGGVKYAGYRYLQLAYIPSEAAARDYFSWRKVDVASVNIKPTNGYVHALSSYASDAYNDNNSDDLVVYNLAFFGFDPFNFYLDAVNAGIE